MSAVVGLLHLDRRPVDQLALRRMMRSVAHRGPDGCNVWHRGHVGLGHAMLQTVPEAESLPRADSDLAISADVRLDNREELMAALGIRDPSISDPELILAAYRCWGDKCPEHLLGDFAFVIWDGRQELLLCARDHFGIKPFYYYFDRDRFAFASEIKALFALGDIQRRVVEARIADYLVGFVADTESTFYEGVFRLPARHCLTVKAKDRRKQEYWTLDAEGAPPPEGDLAEQFRELFTTAVRSRLRSPGQVGAMLSGGLDSSSIACVAAPIVARTRGQSLPTFSLVFDQTPQWSERKFIESVLARGGFQASFVAADGYAPFADFSRILREQDGAYLAPGLSLTRRVYEVAASQGIRVLLSGHGGDEIVSRGDGRLHELAVAGRWLALWREARALNGSHSDTSWHLFSAFLKRYGPPRHLQKVRRVLRALRRPHAGAHSRPAWSRFVNPDLAAHTDLRDRYRTYSRASFDALSNERTRHASILSSSLQSYAFEVLDLAAAANGIALRYPFWDRRLVEFCVALPSDAKLKDGWPRLVLRRAMQDILPSEVQWRRDKLDFTPHLVRGMLANHRRLLDTILLEDTQSLAAYVDLEAVRDAYRRMTESAEAANGSDVQAVWRIAALALWLRQVASPTDSASLTNGP